MRKLNSPLQFLEYERRAVAKSYAVCQYGLGIELHVTDCRHAL